MKRSRNFKIEFKDIEDVICEHFEVNSFSLWNGGKRKKFSKPRSIFYYISFYVNDCVHEKVISDFTGQSRVTVISAIRRVSNLMECDKEYDKEVSDIYKKCAKLHKKECSVI